MIKTELLIIINLFFFIKKNRNRIAQQANKYNINELEKIKKTN